MTTQPYYADRLGFNPNDPREMTALDPTLHGYEENLSKFKGISRNTHSKHNAAAADADTPSIKKRLKAPPQPPVAPPLCFH